MRIGVRSTQSAAVWRREALNRWTRQPHRLRRLLRDEGGIALISALGTLAVLTGLGASVVAYSSSNYRAAELSESDGVGGHLAEAGYNQAVALLSKNTKATPDGQATLDGGTVSWKGVRTGDLWTITSTATVKNPTGAADLRRTVKGQVRIVIDPNSSGNEAWNYVYADDTTTCTTLPNQVKIQTPFFVRGDLCLGNNSQITGSPLKVGGTVTVSQSASIGAPGAPLGEVHVGKGCFDHYLKTYVSPCSADPVRADGQRVYASQADANVGTITKPPVDLNKWYAEARPGPLGNCTEGSFPGGFDTNASTVKDVNGNYVSRDRSLPQPVNLMPATAYDCVFKDGEHVLGRIAWTGGANGTLTVVGTIYFDGDIVLSNNAKGVYQGRGVIYASGRIEISNWTTLCGVAECNEDAWDPNENLLVFVAGSSTDANGFYIKNNAKFQGAAYVVNDFREENSAIFQGPVIARQLYFTNFSTSAKWVPIWALIEGTPTASSGTTVTPIEQSWGG